MPKRFYILFVARGEDGQLRKIPVPHHYLYVIAVGALIGVLGLTGLASSYVRMLMKVSSYNQLRAEREDLKNRYDHLEQVSKERDIQVASLGSLASEVSSLYGLKPEPELIKAAASDKVESSQLSSSLDRLYTLKTAALTGFAFWCLTTVLCALDEAGVGLHPARLQITLVVVCLVQSILASIAGAWLYKEEDPLGTR